MGRFFRRRLALFLALGCLAEFTLESTRYAAASAAVAVQDTQPDYNPARSSSSDTNTQQYQCERGADAVETIMNCKGVREKRGNDWWWKVLIGIAIAGVVALLLKRTVFAPGSQPTAEQTLLEEGPQLPIDYPEGSLAIHAFAHDGWPIVIDFEPQPGTVTELQVTTRTGRRARTQKFVLDPDGSRGRQLVYVTLGQSGRPRPVPATYFVSSMQIASLDVDRPGSVAPAPLQIFGIGGGPSAVGSVAIEQVTFSRSAPGARFGFVAKSQFHRARAQVQQLQRASGKIRIRPVFDERRSNLSVGPQSGSWPGTEAGSPSRGLHRLQVTGWFTTDDRSWVAALAPDFVVQ